MSLNLISELHSDAVLFCAFSKDGKFLASASRDKTARLYKIRSEVGEFVPGADVKQLSGHTAAVNVVKFSLDGAIALTGSDDRTIRAWRKENDWACVCTLTDFYGPVKRIIFSPVKDPVFVTLAGYRTTLWTMHGNNFTPNCSVDVRSSDKQIKVRVITYIRVFNLVPVDTLFPRHISLAGFFNTLPPNRPLFRQTVFSAENYLQGSHYKT